jgi:hypothetical protein
MGYIAMPYAAEISRSNPTCFLFLVDQSGSMNKGFAGPAGKTKAQGVADAINRLLQNLVLKCTKSEGTRDYFHVGVIGYGAETSGAFGGALAGRNLVPISELANKPLRLEERTKKLDDGAGGILEQKVKFPVWFEPKADGKTPMCRALALARESISEFLTKFPSCYPPLVINITDGMATDGSPDPPATAVKNLASTDGNVLLFNACLSSRQVHAIEFPDAEDSLPDDYARILFRMSSLLPVKIHAAARAEGFRVTDATRGFVFNADLVSVIRFIDIGTKVANQAQLPPESWSAPKPTEQARSGSDAQPAAVPAQQAELSSKESAVHVSDKLEVPAGKPKASMLAFLALPVIALPLFFFSLWAFHKASNREIPPVSSSLEATSEPADEGVAGRAKPADAPRPEADPYPECKLVRKWVEAKDPELTILEWGDVTDYTRPEQPDRKLISLKATIQRGGNRQPQKVRFLMAKGEVLGLSPEDKNEE